MNLLDLVAVLLVTAGAIAFVNYRLVKLPPAVAMLAGGMVGAVAILAADRVWPNAGLDAAIARLLADVDFSTLLMNGMLGFLLFAGALTVDIAHLREQLGPVLTLATVGVLLSTAIVETGARLLFAIAGVPVPFAWCLVFGALISPTDPVAVLAIMETLRVPKSLEINVTGESLLNDGVGVVVFTVLLALASAPGSVSPTAVALLFAREVVGGVLLGAAGRVVAYQAMKRVDEPNVEVQLSVALVIALIAIGAHAHVSAPLACVTAGIIIGNEARRHAMRDPTREALDHVWSFAVRLRRSATGPHAPPSRAAPRDRPRADVGRPARRDLRRPRSFAAAVRGTRRSPHGHVWSGRVRDPGARPYGGPADPALQCGRVVASESPQIEIDVAKNHGSRRERHVARPHRPP